MDLGIAGKVAWVTGASSGIGLATARALAAEGARVALSARRADLLEEEALRIGDSGTECLAVPLDITDGAAIDAAAIRIAERLGPVDILVCNGGGPPPGTFDELDVATVEKGFELTLLSAWRLTSAVSPDMKARGAGAILYFTSSSTKEVIPGLLLSNVMRPGVVGLMKTVSKELGPHGIRALCVAPGRIETDRLRSLDERNAQLSGVDLDSVRDEMQSRIPLGRYGDPDEFGDVAAFLASERASFVTGITVTVDGGMLNGILS